MKIKLPELQKVTLKSGKRFYITPDGSKYPSVTTVLSDKKKEQLRRWREKVGEDEANRIKNEACKRGTKLHTLCEKYLLHKGEYEDIVDGLFTPFVPYLDKISDIHCLEQHLYSDTLRVAGQVDCIAMYDGQLSVIDFKTSSKEKKKEYIWDYFMQVSAYSYMFEERTGITISNITILITSPGGKVQVFQDKRENWIDGFKQLREEYEKTVVQQSIVSDNKQMSDRITNKWTETTAEAFGDNEFTRKGDTAEKLAYDYLKRVYDSVEWNRDKRDKQIVGKDFEFKKKEWKYSYSVDVKGNLHDGKFLVYIDEIENKLNHRMMHIDVTRGKAVEYSRDSMLEYIDNNKHLVKVDKNNKRYVSLKSSDPLLLRRVSHFRFFRVAKF